MFPPTSQQLKVGNSSANEIGLDTYLSIEVVFWHLIIVVNYISAGLALKNTFAAISTMIKKTSTIATPRRHPLKGFLGSVTWVFMIVRNVDGITALHLAFIIGICDDCAWKIINPVSTMRIWFLSHSRC
jgi:hypothetical protein